jgi:cytoskeletal protein CcmA (bactofilin family)
MPARIEMKPVTCPACGSSQQEAAGVISTFCRACGHHFEVRDQTTPARKPEPPPAPATGGQPRSAPLLAWLQRALDPWRLRYQPQFDKVRALIERWRPPQFRRVRCHECARIHEAPFAAASTACPTCNAHIDLSDYLVDKRQSRVVRTRGNLSIKKFGYLNNQLTICGSADIAGGAAGKLFCDGETRILTSGRLNCEIGSRRVRIEKGADVVVAHPIRVHEMIIRGKLTARVYCNGTLRILKHGFLKGEVHARSITVDKGGLLHAELNIGHFDEVDPEVLGTLQERTCYMAIEDAVPTTGTAPLAS